MTQNAKDTIASGFFWFAIVAVVAVVASVAGPFLDDLARC